MSTASEGNIRLKAFHAKDVAVESIENLDELHPGEFYEAYVELKERAKLLAEVQAALLAKYYEIHGETEEAIGVWDEKKGKSVTKYVRVYEPVGFFVYNRPYDVGLRAKPAKGD